MAKTVALSEIEWPTLLEEVQKGQEEVVVTKDGQPIAKVVPIGFAAQRRLRSLEELRGSVTVLGDIVEPLDEEWDADK
jgi:prevent-host-death family protein